MHTVCRYIYKIKKIAFFNKKQTLIVLQEYMQTVRIALYIDKKIFLRLLLVLWIVLFFFVCIIDP